MPRITDIEPQKKNKSRSNLYIDGVFFAGASNYAIRKYKLEIGKDVEQEKLKSLLFEDELEKAKGYVIDYHLNKSHKKIREKLKEKQYDETIIEAVMDFIERYHLVDDGEYARKKAKDSLFIGKKGKRVISQTLKQNGISEEQIEAALAHLSDEDQVDMAKKALRSKMTTYERKAKDPYDFKQKCYRFLMGRGFTGDIITRVLDDLNREE